MMPLSKPMRGASRFIPSEDLGAARQWSFGSVDFDEEAARRAVERERAQAEQAREASYANGFEDGLAAGREESSRDMAEFMRVSGRALQERIDGLLGQLGDELERSREAMAAQLVDLACEIARQVVRRELATQPDQVVDVTREALGLLVQDSSPRVIRLNPDDLALMQAAREPDAARDHPESPLVLRADPDILRGGCVVESAGSVIDATVQRRWQRVLGRLGMDRPWSAGPQANDNPDQDSPAHANGD